MKTKYLIHLLLLMAFTLSSCREITVKTKVNNDGSFTRIITVTGDSSEAATLHMPYPVDSSWLREFHRDTADSTVYICTLTKTFKNDDLLNDEIRNDTSWKKQIQRDVEVSKRFMFFYSFMTYRQVYKAANPFSQDYKEHFNREELLWISEEKLPETRQDSILSDSANSKAEQYLNNVLIDEIIGALAKGIDQLGDAQLMDIDLSLYKDSIAVYAMEWASPDKLENSIDALISWSGNQHAARLHNIEPSIFEDLYKKITLVDNLIFEDHYTIEVEMPGLITETNSRRMVGNTVSWNIQAWTFFYEDYEMSVESRVINYWAFILSGAVVLLLLIALVVKLFR